MKKSIFILMTVVLGMTACNDVEQVIVETSSVNNLTMEEQNVIDKLISIGLSEDVANKIIIEVVRPQNTLERTYRSQIAIEGVDGLFKNGMYQLVDGPGPGESGGPLADKCVSPGKKCKVSNSVHIITQIEMDTFFPGGLDDLYAIVGSDGFYDEYHPYVDYLTIIFND